jgi:hypothetical protein
MDEKDLIAALSSTEPYFLKDTTVTAEGNIIIEFAEKEKTISFNNVIFNKPIIFRNLDFKGSLSFYQCQFSGGIGINNCKIKLNTAIQSSHSLYFYLCNFSAQIIQVENKSSFESLVEIESAHGLQKVFLFESSFTSFQLKNTKFSGFEINKNSFNQWLRIEDCVVEGQMRQSSSTYGSLVWMNNEFKKDIFLKDDIINHDISIQDNIFEETVNIDPYIKVVPNSRLNVISNKFKKSFTISYYKKINDKIDTGGPETICISSNEFDDGLTIAGDNSHDSAKLKTLGIDISNRFAGQLKINEFHIEHFHITGENYKGNIILKSLWIKKLEIINFANYSSFQFIKCHPLDVTSSFKIHESYLEKFQFTGCFLDDFSEFDIENSNLSLIKSSNTKWFNFEQLERSKKVIGKDKSIEPEIKRLLIKAENSRIYLEIHDTFRQLKYAMEQQGDRVNALIFKSYEMEAYHKYLKLNYNFLYRDRLILLLGKTNSHGVNWKIPLIFICLLTVLFYIIMVFEESTKYYIGGTKWMFLDFLKDLWENKKIMPQLLNPIHKVEDLFRGKQFVISGWTYSLL